MFRLQGFSWEDCGRCFQCCHPVRSRGAVFAYGTCQVSRLVSFFTVRGLRQIGSMAAGLPMASLALPAPGLCETVSYLGLLLLLLDMVGGRRGDACSKTWLTVKPPRTATASRRLLGLILMLVLCFSVGLRYYCGPGDLLKRGPGRQRVVGPRAPLLSWIRELGHRQDGYWSIPETEGVSKSTCASYLTCILTTRAGWENSAGLSR